MEKLKQLTREHLDKVDVMQLATQADGQPWCCTVHFFVDDDFNIYWMSTEKRRHSLEIGESAPAAIAMAVESRAGHPVIGIQVEGDARRIHDASEDVITAYAARHGRDGTFVKEVLNGESEHKLYQLVPRLFQLFDKKNFPDSPQQQWQP